MVRIMRSLLIGLLSIFLFIPVCGAQGLEKKEIFRSTTVTQALKKSLDTKGNWRQICYAEGTAPSTPPIGVIYTYMKTDGAFYMKDDTGTETQISGGGGSGNLNTALSNPDSPIVISLSNNDAGTANTIFGSGAGANITAGGDENTVIGHNALVSNSTGTGNVTIGYLAGNGVTGNGVIAIGSDTLVTTTAINNTVAIGNLALNALTTGNQNIAIGFRALLLLSSGEFNTAIGYAAGENMTIANANTLFGSGAGAELTTGDENVAIGVDALHFTTTGTKNTAIGYAAMNFGTGIVSSITAIGYKACGGAVLTSGADGTIAIGDLALFNLTSGGQNTGIGPIALTNLTTGSGNVAVGEAALTANISGSHNVAVGVRALAGVITGNNIGIGSDTLSTATPSSSATIAIGREALQDLTSGSKNIAIGYRSLTECTSGISNTTLGYEAGQDILTGSSNIIIGESAGFFLTTGQENIVIGSSALLFSTSGSRNVAIGESAMEGAFTGVNDCIGIGYLALEGSVTSNANGAVAIGSRCLSSLESGEHNTAVGYQAGRDMTTGLENSIFGYEAGLLLTTGAENIVIGYKALSTSLTSTGNIAIGKETMQNVLSGVNETTAVGHLAIGIGAMTSAADSVTAIGTKALLNLTTGGSNTCVGNSAGESLTTGGANTCIGADTGTSAATSDNQIVIGKGFSGTANDSVHIGNNVGHIDNQYTVDALWSQTSDERRKNILGDSKLGLKFINAIHTKRFILKAPSEYPKEWLTYNPDDTKPATDKVIHGFIAQDVRKALDKVGVQDWRGWKINPDGTQRLAPGAFVVPLVKAVQELSKQNKILATRIATLETEHGININKESVLW